MRLLARVGPEDPPRDQGLALRGLDTGGRCFGYSSVKSSDGSARLEVSPSQAEIINCIYRLYAESGFSMKRIAHTLNSEGVPAPQPQKGRFSQSWCVSSVRHILHGVGFVFLEQGSEFLGHGLRVSG